ncbi:MAG: signal recognition particle-docking protein FtsY [Bdellovibrionota bacterium]
MMDLVNSLGWGLVELGVVGLVLLSVLGAGLFAALKNRKTSTPSEIPKSKPEEVVLKPREKLVSLEEALANTKKGFWGRLSQALGPNNSLESHEMESIEEVLYTSDLGPKTVHKLLLQIQNKAKGEQLNSESLRSLLKSEMKDIFKKNSSELSMITNTELKHKPEVWMIIGVNGAGKTTTIGKLSNKLASQGLKVMIAAGDTFRAAAKEQLKVWADRSSVLFFSPEGVDNPSGVAFDAVKAASEAEVDVLIVDTAGRLHTQSHLMEELKKIKRVMEKAVPGTPHEVLLVLDANSGQNALIQAKEFNEAIGVTGVIITKMDGTAKGGVALGVVSDLNLNIKLIGVGEKVEDLRTFNSEEFINSII